VINYTNKIKLCKEPKPRPPLYSLNVNKQKNTDITVFNIYPKYKQRAKPTNKLPKIISAAFQSLDCFRAKASKVRSFLTIGPSYWLWGAIRF